MTSGSFGADPAALSLVAQGIETTIQDLKQLGVVGTAEEGRGFSMLEMTQLTAGDHDLAEAFGDFCSRWSWGIRTLVQSGNEIAQRLNLSAGKYHDEDEYLMQTFKVIGVDAIGDLSLTEDQARKNPFGDSVRSGVTPVSPFSQESRDLLEQTAKKDGQSLAKDLPRLTPEGRIVSDVVGVARHIYPSGQGDN